MTEQHPITPPPELVQQWDDEAMKGFRTNRIYEQDIATQAARWARYALGCPRELATPRA